MLTLPDDKQMSHYQYQTIDHSSIATALGIGPGDRVLDTGGGHQPFARADVVVDIDFQSGSHRDGTRMSMDASRHHYVQADITALPFSNKSFDFVICSQVLEHVVDPAAACDELMRVARRGYLETPRKWTEFYAGHPTHRWLVDDCNETLTFEPIRFNSSPFLNFALPVLWSSPEMMKSFTGEYHNVSCVQITWADSFKYRVLGHPGDLPPYESPAETAARHYNFARNLLYWMAPPERGLYHAARAAEISRGNPVHSRLYAFYLALCGQWRLAREHGLTLKLASFAVIGILAFRFYRWSTRWCRNIITIFFPI